MDNAGIYYKVLVWIMEVYIMGILYTLANYNINCRMCCISIKIGIDFHLLTEYYVILIEILECKVTGRYMVTGMLYGFAIIIVAGVLWFGYVLGMV